MFLSFTFSSFSSSSSSSSSTSSFSFLKRQNQGHLLIYSLNHFLAKNRGQIWEKAEKQNRRSSYSLRFDHVQLECQWSEMNYWKTKADTQISLKGCWTSSPFLIKYLFLLHLDQLLLYPHLNNSLCLLSLITVFII